MPLHHASGWITYEFQEALLKGLGIGAGLYYVGKRDPNLPNTYRLPGYVHVDAALYYRRGAWQTQLNLVNLFVRRYYTGGALSVFNYTPDPTRPFDAVDCQLSFLINAPCTTKSMIAQKLCCSVRRIERGSTGWKWMSSTPFAASPGRRDA